jgi:hypothetical protein
MSRWPKTTLAERFWSKVDKRGINDCWEWQAYTHKFGYGIINDNKKIKKAHRVSWELHNGDTQGLYVLHKCDNRKCVNPNHLFLGTQLDNIDDMVTKNRHAKGKDHSNKFLGEKNHQSKLTEKDIIEIKESLRNGIRGDLLASKFNVSAAHISNIKNGKYWGHI